MQHELTEVEINKIKEEISYRQQEVTPVCIAEVQRTRALGDLSENDEYRSAKRELNKNYSRIRYLKGLLEGAIIVNYESDADTIGLFDTVTFHDEDFDEERTVTIVTPLRHDILSDKISKDSPLGKSLLGHKVGDRITIRVNESSSYEIVIIDLEKGMDDDTLHIH